MVACKNEEALIGISLASFLPFYDDDLVGEPGGLHLDIDDGIVVVPKGTSLPPGTFIGPNQS